MVINPSGSVGDGQMSMAGNLLICLFYLDRMDVC